MIKFIIENVIHYSGVIGCIWTAVWLIVISETPNGDKYISEAEKEYIEDSLGTAIKVVRKYHKMLPVFLNKYIC